MTPDADDFDELEEELVACCDRCGQERIGPMKRLLPDRVYLGASYSFSVEHAIRDNEHKGIGEMLMSFILPPFQRPPVWNRKQNIRFMESLILGLPVGTYTYCSAIETTHTDGWLIDGQQRMRAIKNYLANDFPVFGFFWRDLPIVDQRRVRSMSFPAYVLNEASEAECLERYLKLNYSGTPHTEADKRRAKKFARHHGDPQ